MSIKLMSAIWQIQGLSQGQKLVLLSLADNSNEDGVCWPSISTISSRSCMGERSVTRTLSDLERMGFLKREIRSGRPTIYHITPVLKTPPSLSHPVTSVTTTPVLKTPTPVLKTPPLNNPYIDITLKEPSIEIIISMFERFWSLYPRQRIGNKGKAFSAWKNALQRGQAEEIIAGVEKYAASDEVKNGFAKGAAAWLNDDRWNTQYEITPKIGKVEINAGDRMVQKNIEYLRSGGELSLEGIAEMEFKLGKNWRNHV